MNKLTFFDFCHLLYQHDTMLVKVDSDMAHIICEEAQLQFGKDFLSGLCKTPTDWINNHYNSWQKQYVYCSAHMPDNVKQILTR